MRQLTRLVPLVMLVPVALLALAGALPAAAAPPSEGDCPTVSLDPTPEAGGIDAGPVVLEEGMVLGEDSLFVLRSLIPSEIWQHRETFFHEGMQMEIGPCHRVYSPPRFFATATERFAGTAKLDDDGNLKSYEAGLPFPPESIDPEGADAAAHWAQNLQHRYRGAGLRGSFRITDLPSGPGTTERYRGDFFLLQTSHRADLADQGYSVPEAKKKLFAAGGEFQEPFNARHLAWRQFRPLSSERRFGEADNIFVYVPSMRKQRRAATAWVDGLFLPRYSVTGAGGGGGLAIGGGESINPTAGLSIAETQHMERGMLGLALRANAYVWRYKGERTVLAPLNASRSGYPEESDRNFGHSGISVASDRWDVRQAVVIEGALREPGERVRTVTIWIDYQTQQPLFWITRAHRNRLVDIGILVHRFSDDIPGYPEWPGGLRAGVFEPVAASFMNALAGRGGWLRESYDLVSTPFSEDERRRMTSADTLEHGN